MKKIILLVCIILTGVGIALWYASQKATLPETQGSLRVVASVYPLGEFASRVGGVGVSVSIITRVGSEPHDFEPTIEDIRHAHEADIFLFNGAGFDPWAQNIQASLEKEGVKVVEMVGKVPLRGDDPHIWLDPNFAIIEIEAIRDAFGEKDPSQASLYTQNAGLLTDELRLLDARYRRGLSSCRLREIVVSHDAFGYLGARYGFDIVSLAGLSPDQEPSPSQIARVIEVVREKGIEYIFTEPLVSSKIADTVARETGAYIATLNPLEGLLQSEEAAGAHYVSLMEDNLGNLTKALSCEKK